MKIMFRWPTFGRLALFRERLGLLRKALSEDGDWVVSVVIEARDETMNRREVLAWLAREPRVEFSVRHTNGKHAAYNAELARPWDVYVTWADDLIPAAASVGIDERIRAAMAEHFPDLDGALWFKDPVYPHLCTHPVIGRAYYERFGYVLQPAYHALWADVEFTDVARRDGRLQFVQAPIWHHQHWRSGEVQRDATYLRGWEHQGPDGRTWAARRDAGYPAEWTPLPPVQLAAPPDPGVMQIALEVDDARDRKVVAEELWARLYDAAADGVPLLVQGCGARGVVGRKQLAAALDIPCPCGNPRHWLVKWRRKT
jgi:hypothetical protein